MITRIHVTNFKSFDDFVLDKLGPFVCLIGMNGSGKTTFLQLLGVIRAAMRGNVFDFSLGGHEVDFKDFLTAGNSKRTFSVEIDFRLSSGAFRWQWLFNVAERATSFESVAALDETSGEEGRRVFLYKEKKIHFNDSVLENRFSFKGSFLAYLRLDAGNPLFELRNEVGRIMGLGVMDPIAISAPAKASGKHIFIEENGKNLPAFISRLSPEQLAEFVQTVQAFYGNDQLSDIRVQGRQFGWKRLAFSELSKTLDSVHLSYGTLRFMAMAAMKYTDSSILYFDEVENGINQECFNALLSLLTSFSGKQVFITSHSAVFLNYLSDEQARASVFFLWRDPSHHAHATKFFEIDSDKAQELKYTGAGEVMSLTDLRELASDLSKSED